MIATSCPCFTLKSPFFAIRGRDSNKQLENAASLDWVTHPLLLVLLKLFFYSSYSSYSYSSFFCPINYFHNLKLFMSSLDVLSECKPQLQTREGLCLLSFRSSIPVTLSQISCLFFEAFSFAYSSSFFSSFFFFFFHFRSTAMCLNCYSQQAVHLSSLFFCSSLSSSTFDRRRKSYRW